MPNNQAGQTVSYLMQSGLQTAMLGHLSKENNFPELAYKTVTEELINNNQDVSKISLSVASRDNPGKILNL